MRGTSSPREKPDRPPERSKTTARSSRQRRKEAQAEMRSKGKERQPDGEKKKSCQLGRERGGEWDEVIAEKKVVPRKPCRQGGRQCKGKRGRKARRREKNERDSGNQVFNKVEEKP